MRTRKNPVGNVHDGQVKHTQAHQQKGHGVDDGRTQPAEHLNGSLRHQTAQHTAGIQHLTLIPQRLHEILIPRQNLTQQTVENTGEHQRKCQGKAHSQPYRPAAVERQNIRTQQQGRSCQPIAIAQHALDQTAKEVNEYCLNIKISKSTEYRQQQTDKCPHFSSYRPFLRLLLFAASGNTAFRFG